jgi:DNA polymerase-1
MSYLAMQDDPSLKMSLGIDNIGTVQVVYIASDVKATQAITSIPKNKVLGLDIETGYSGDMAVFKAKEKRPVGPQPGLDPHLSRIRLVQIFDGFTAYVFDLAYVDYRLLSHLLKTSKFIAHNAVFEAKHLQYLYKQSIDIQCSMLMCILKDCAEKSPYEPTDPDEETRVKGFSLEAMSAKYFKFQPDKTLQAINWWQATITNEHLVYAALDSVLTYGLNVKVSPYIKQYRMSKVLDLLTKMTSVVADMEVAGVGFDTTKHTNLIADWTVEEARTLARCKELIGDINFNSPKQLGEWAVKTFPNSVIANWPTTKTGALTFNRAKIALMAKKTPSLEAYLEYKKVSKLLSTYGSKLAQQVHPLTKRIHCSYFIGSTRTGRLSSGNPNLQNQPRTGELRDCFVPKQGHVLIVADYSQIEMRVAAELSNDRVMKASFKDGIDLHKLIVHAITGKKMSDITKSDRQLGKAVNFGLMFGMGANKLRDYAAVNYGIFMDEEEGYSAYNAFHRLYAGYSSWCENVRAEADSLGYYYTILGKRRALLTTETYTKSINTAVQGSAAEVLMVALIDLYRRGLKLVLTVHDEIALEAPMEDAEWQKDRLVDVMQQAMLSLFPKAPTNGLIEVDIGSTWAEAK